MDYKHLNLNFLPMCKKLKHTTVLELKNPIDNLTRENHILDAKIKKHIIKINQYKIRESYNLDVIRRLQFLINP